MGPTYSWDSFLRVCCWSSVSGPLQCQGFAGFQRQLWKPWI